MYPEREVDEIRLEGWQAKDWDDLSKREDLIDLTKHSAEQHIRYQTGRVPLNLVIEILSEERMVKWEMDYVELKVRCLYSYREYTGPREGNIMVYSVPTKEEYASRGEYDAALDYVATVLPEAVRRVGCYCCYGDGPDIETKNYRQTLEVWVNFDFDITEYVPD